jgi:hypothetical protein
MVDGQAYPPRPTTQYDIAKYELKKQFFIINAIYVAPIQGRLSGALRIG